MAKLNVEALRKQAERAVERRRLKAIRSDAEERKKLAKQARPKANAIIKTIPKLLRKKARQGGTRVEVLRSTSVSDERLFNEIRVQISSYCHKNNLWLDSSYYPGDDGYPAETTLYVELRNK